MAQQDNSEFWAFGIGLAGMMTILLIALAITLLPLIFYNLTLQKAFKRCAPESRAMEPGLVWLLLIPMFNAVWHFFVVLNMAKSLGAEFQRRGIAAEPAPGKNLGLAMCILGCCCLIPLVNFLACLPYLICWIVYWVKIAGFSGRLAPAPGAAA
jgi:hypothetical protein